MFHLFQGGTADLAWRRVADQVAAGRFVDVQSSRAGTTREILHAAISIEDPRQRWIISRRPVLNIAFALAEVVWILQGRSDAAFLNYFNHKLIDFAGSGSTYHGAYGFRLRRQFGVDQLERAYLALRSNPDSRQVVLQIWDAKVDLPDLDGSAVNKDIPCNITSIIKVRNSRLEWLQIMRSNDLFRGFPYNVVQFTTIQEVLAGWLRIDVGGYHHLSDSLHVYDDTSDCLRSYTNSEPSLNTDNLAVEKILSDAAFATLEKLIECVISSSVTLADLYIELRKPLPEAHRNIALVLCAEGARRRKDRQAAAELVSECTNPAYKELYSLWLDRTKPAIVS